MKRLGVAEVEGVSVANLVDGDPNTFVRVGDTVPNTRAG